MSGAEQTATAAADRQGGKAATGDTSRKPSSSIAQPSGGSILPTMLMAAGGLLAGALAGASLLALPAAPLGSSTLEMVAKADLADAIVSLGPLAPAAAVAEAQTCKSPLAYVTVSADVTTSPGTIRIRSGSFLTPTIRLTPSPRRIAIPFPAPYPTGRGMLVVEGVGQGVNVWLSPGQYYSKLESTAAINVIWTAKSPC